ncbi:MAG: transposase [Mycobacteriales bacterium]|nr:MAG: hypothetical protein DLM56_06605 [Pseudonocardiales bacterium]
MAFWDPERVEHIGTRFLRYPGSVSIPVEWAEDATDDPVAIVSDPDPRSGPPIVRVGGYSSTAGLVITVVCERKDGELWGVTAWKTSGRERRSYWEAAHARERD